MPLGATLKYGYDVSLFEQGMQLSRKAAEERLSGNTGGMSFLARQRQASSRRTTPNRTQQTSAVSSRQVPCTPLISLEIFFFFFSE